MPGSRAGGPGGRAGVGSGFGLCSGVTGRDGGASTEEAQTTVCLQVPQAAAGESDQRVGTDRGGEGCLVRALLLLAWSWAVAGPALVASETDFEGEPLGFADEMDGDTTFCVMC